MDPDALDDAGRVPHGSSDDEAVTDLSANVNPHVPDGVEAAYRGALDDARRYPPDTHPEYRRAAAEYVGCDPDHVVATPGGTAAIRLAVECTVSRGDSVLVPAPSFGEYAREVRLQGADTEFVLHDELVTADPEDHALAMVCVPNNPTGDAPDPEVLRSFTERCRESGTPLLVDEAFLGFTDRPSLAGTPGAIVARSLTKLFGLPGLRAGFAVATGDHRDRLGTARPPWALGTPAAAVGAHCMRDTAFVAETRERVAAERERLRDELAARGFDVHPSVAPFLLVDVGTDPGDLLAALRERGVVLRDATTFRGLDSHVRIAVRSASASDELLAALDEVDATDAGV